MRELAYIDPDGNLLLFGSPIEEATPAAGRRGQAADAEAPHQSDVFEFARALKRGQAEKVAAFLADDPSLATATINSCRPLHLYADAPGHRPNPEAIVRALIEAGAQVDAHALGTWHHETALHWAASNDDVELIDALLDAGADIEHPGSSIGGGPPAQSALGYAQWHALRRLYSAAPTPGCRTPPPSDWWRSSPPGWAPTRHRPGRRSTSPSGTPAGPVSWRRPASF